MNEDIINDATSLLEECIINGKSGKDALYAWFLGEQVLITSTVKELILEEKELNIRSPKWPEGPERIDEGSV